MGAMQSTRIKVLVFILLSVGVVSIMRLWHYTLLSTHSLRVSFVRSESAEEDSSKQVASSWTPMESMQNVDYSPLDLVGDNHGEHEINGTCTKRLRVISPHPHNFMQVNYWMHHLAAYLGVQRESMYFTPAPNRLTKTYLADPCTFSIVILPRPSHEDCKGEKIIKSAFYQHVIKMRDDTKVMEGGLIDASPSRAGEWVNGVYWPKKHKFVRLANNRPLLIYVTGEVFDTHGPKPSADVVLYTAQEPIAETITGNFNLGIAYAWKRQVYSREFAPAAYDPERLVQPPEILGNKEHFEKLLDSKKEFAGMVNSAVIKFRWHHLDAVIRFALCSLLAEYKSCVNLGGTPPDDKFLVHHNRKMRKCQGDDLEVIGCLKQFKFVISMENTVAPGYFTEKLFYAKLAGAVPIYFGATNAEEFVNTDSFVYCNINPELIYQMREKAGGKFLAEIANRVDSSLEYAKLLSNEVPLEAEKPERVNGFRRASDREAIAFVRLELKEELQKCVERIKFLDENREEYLKVAMTPLFKNNQYQNTVIDGGVLARGIAELIQYTRY